MKPVFHHSTKLGWFLVLLTLFPVFAEEVTTLTSVDEPVEEPVPLHPTETQHTTESLDTGPTNPDDTSDQDLPTFSSDLVGQASEVVDRDSENQDKTLEHPVETSTAGIETNNTLDTSNSTASSNGTNESPTNGTVNCHPRDMTDANPATVQMANGTTLLKELTPASNDSDGQCAVVLFYFPWCMFSARAAPHFNALPRVFPQISFYAIDADSRNNLNMRYGLVAVPTVLLFHNGRVIAKFNESVPTLEKFVTFINKYTGLSPPPENVTITKADMEGPVPTTPIPKTDYILILCWIFCLTCFTVAFLRSALCGRIVECIRNTWREAEAQHEHEE